MMDMTGETGTHTHTHTHIYTGIQSSGGRHSEMTAGHSSCRPVCSPSSQSEKQSVCFTASTTNSCFPQTSQVLITEGQAGFKCHVDGGFHRTWQHKSLIRLFVIGRNSTCWRRGKQTQFKISLSVYSTVVFLSTTLFPKKAGRLKNLLQYYYIFLWIYPSYSHVLDEVVDLLSF